MTNDITLSGTIYVSEIAKSVKVKVFTTNVDDQYTKLLVNIAPAVSTAKYKSGPNSTKIIDLLRITHRFEVDGFVSDDYGTATSGGNNSLTDTAKTWIVDSMAGKTIKIINGLGAGASKTIVSNTANVITISGTWTTNPDSTSVYEIISSAAVLKSNLVSLLKAGGTMSLVYAGTTYTVNMEKCSIKETPEDSANPSKYDVKISLIEGENI